MGAQVAQHGLERVGGMLQDRSVPAFDRLVHIGQHAGVVAHIQLQHVLQQLQVVVHPLHQFLTVDQLLALLLVPAHRFEQALARDRLDQKVVRPQSDPPIPVVDHGRHDDRNILQLRIGLEHLQHAPPVHARHHHVQDDGRRLLFPREHQSLGAVGRGQRGKTSALQITPHQLAHRPIVVDHQHQRPILRMRFDSCRVGLRHPLLNRAALLHLRRKANGEGRTAARLARHRDIPAQHQAEPLRYRQPQTRASVAARRRRIRLPKRLEHLFHLLRAHADSRISHLELQPLSIPHHLTLHSHVDPSLFRKLGRVRQQIEQDLPHLGLI